MSVFNVEEFTEQVETPVKNVLNKAISFIPSFLMTVLILALSTIGDLIEFNFNFNKINWVSFASSTALMLVILILSKNLGADLRFQTGQNLPALIDLKADFNKYAKQVNLVDFEKWVTERNRKSKIKAYIKSVDKKKYRLESEIEQLKAKQLLKHKKSTETLIARKTAKLTAYDEKKTDLYIDKYIDVLKVEYEHLLSANFVVETEYAETKATYSMNEHAENWKEILKGLPLTLLLLLIGALISIEPVFNGNSGAIIGVLFDLSTVCFNFAIGWFLVGNKTLAKQMLVYANKKRILQEFLQNHIDK